MNDHHFLSEKPISSEDRLIFALDVATEGEALRWVDLLGDAVTFYKLGLEFCMSGRYFEVMAELLARRKKVFADLKFSDVPATVCGAVANLADRGATYCTLHGTSGVYREVVTVKGAMKLLAVTVLTSVGPDEVDEMGWSGPVEDLVSKRARIAVAAGVDGLISSGREASRLRQELGAGPLIITPGIRAADQQNDDQKRTMTLREAFLAGADQIVVGRPIRNATNPRAKATEMQAEIAELFARSGGE